MRYTYDDGADALYIHLRGEHAVARSIVVDDDRTVDVDGEGRAVGIEVLGASQRVRLRDLIAEFSLDGLREPLERLEHAVFTRAARGA